ncbi:RGCVC family protein [Blastococcus sp. TML/M2B]|uniref:RGCVC family protein n=1 Tax=unclassified Blastococcus TaxID=2619396 RepID=UPI00190A2DE6|nr:RGCVC family protein [Blastococcus sp. TML/M2B]MBN1097015.1 RGCVC family protein [Blastococcus sp. TML/C7B]
MTAPASTAPRPTAPAPGCAACPHPVGNHDPVALRWCRATTGSALDRTCVCPTG